MCDMKADDMNSENKNIDPIGLLPKIFSGEATDEEKRLVDEWMGTDPANRNEYDAFARLWNLTALSSPPDEIDIEKEWRRIDRSISQTGNKTINLYYLIRIAAAVILISVLSYTVFRSMRYNSVKAPASALKVVQLPDGSKVSLNAGSKIVYRKGFGITDRNLSLRGEAYFEVNKGQIPFIIEAGEAMVRVTGTKFNVKAYAGRTEIRVTVTEGTVKLYRSGLQQHETFITAGETGLFDRSEKTFTKLSTADQNDLSWKTGIIDFRNTPFPEVTDILMNTYHISLSSDPVLNHCTVTVRFENQKPDSVLNVLKSTLNLSITKKGKRYILSGKGC